jgi:hypothetical protein
LSEDRTLLNNDVEMKARVGYFLAVLPLVFAFSVAAIARPDSDSHLKIYNAPQTGIRAGFVPEKAQVVLAACRT